MLGCTLEDPYPREYKTPALAGRQPQPHGRGPTRSPRYATAATCTGAGDYTQLPHQPERVVLAAVVRHFASGEAVDADAGHGQRFAGRRDTQHLPAMGATEPPPGGHLVAFGDLLLDGHLRVRERGVELSEEVLEGLRAAHRLTEHGEGDGDVRRGELVDQAQIARDPDLDEAASEGFVLVYRHGVPLSWPGSSLNQTDGILGPRLWIVLQARQGGATGEAPPFGHSSWMRPAAPPRSAAGARGPRTRPAAGTSGPCATASAGSGPRTPRSAASCGAARCSRQNANSSSALNEGGHLLPPLRPFQRWS
jgi:hypothetical protein